MELIFRYFWVIALFVTFINATALKARFKKDSAAHPERARGYRIYLAGYTAAMVLIWLTMGIGIELFGIKNIWVFFQPRQGLWYTLFWHAILVIIGTAFCVWMVLLDGAEFMIAHPRILQRVPPKSNLIRFRYVIYFISLVVAEFMFWTGYFDPMFENAI